MAFNYQKDRWFGFVANEKTQLVTIKPNTNFPKIGHCVLPKFIVIPENINTEGLTLSYFVDGCVIHIWKLRNLYVCESNTYKLGDVPWIPMTLIKEIRILCSTPEVDMEILIDYENDSFENIQRLMNHSLQIELKNRKFLRFIGGNSAVVNLK